MEHKSHATDDSESHNAGQLFIGYYQEHQAQNSYLYIFLDIFIFYLNNKQKKFSGLLGESLWLRLTVLNLEYLDSIKRGLIAIVFLRSLQVTTQSLLPSPRLLLPPQFPHHSVHLSVEVYQSNSILFFSKSQLLDSAEELHQCLVCEEKLQSYSAWILSIFQPQHSEGAYSGQD